MYIHLYRRQTDAGRGVHGLKHIVDQGLQALVKGLDGGAKLSQTLVWKMQNI
jgi:hypothetical protein